MTESTDRNYDARDQGGTPIDRIEGGSLTHAGREIHGIAPTTVLIGAIIVVCFGLFLGWYLFHARTPAGKAATSADAGIAASMPQRDAITEAQARQALLGTPAAAQLEPNGPLAGTTVPGQPGSEAALGVNPASGPPGQKPVDPRVAFDLATRRSPIMGFSGTSNVSQAIRGQAPQAGTVEDGSAAPTTAGDPPQTSDDSKAAPATFRVPSASAGQDALSSQLGHHAIETARATVVPDRDFLLSAGTLVPCTLQTAINSTQAGYVSCVVGQDVFSEDGRVVLLDKGTKVLGQYTGGVSQGQARLFVLWTRALTPRGVAIDLGSPAADDLGRAGMAGGVNTMFWQRFGGALMLSVLEDLGDVASSHFAGRGTQTTQVPADTAGVALQSSINIRPILKKDQGDQVAIFVAKDFDFSGVYDVRVKR